METMNSRDFEVGSKSSNNDETNKNKALISKKQGGNRAALFVYATEGLENMAFIAIAVSLVTYFYGYMNYSLTKSSTMLTNFMGTSFLLALVGGFICDTYLTRFKTCLIFASFELLGYTLLLVQAHRSELRPPKCVDNINHQCVEATTGEASILYVGLYLVALGTGGIKAALPSLGADQFDERDPKESSQLSSFFNWFLFSLTIGAIFGVTVVVWISTNKGWDRGFAVCLVAVFFALLSLTFGKSLYRHNVPKGSPLLRFIRVFVASIKNRKLPIPENSDELYEIGEDKEAAILNNHQEFLQRTDQFKCLDRAAVIRTDGITGKWRVCTVTEVEETKILVRMLPIILSTVFMNTCLAQLQTFSVQQGTTMDTTINGFEVPAASIPVIPLLFMFILIPIYDKIFVPIARRITGIPTGIRHLQRIGVGLVLSAISMTVAGIVEKKRKNVAIEHGMVDSLAPLPISLLWLGFQYAIFGAADMFTLVGLLEFFYAESSAGMKSLSTAISWCSFAFGYYLSTVVVEIVNKVSGGWLANNNLNRDKLEYFYWLLAGLSVVNFGVYVLCASWYRYKKLEVPVVEKNDVLKEIKP
ncbi:protein NRT1/ PTR FAMILY 4.5 [Cannabis sativa]|uniref:protein NRT1/ PTR FAMILY 4.5 n=1 Tax=Cannabis sativa TaxID=3483 RepID=UPI0011DF9A71|nr:protein NRT1/ PTR FAMILY 4.5 [Cannabis sativa]